MSYRIILLSNVDDSLIGLKINEWEIKRISKEDHDSEPNIICGLNNSLIFRRISDLFNECENLLMRSLFTYEAGGSHYIALVCDSDKSHDVKSVVYSLRLIKNS